MSHIPFNNSNRSGDFPIAALQQAPEGREGNDKAQTLKTAIRKSPLQILAIWFLLLPSLAYPAETAYKGLRLLPAYEADVYGPLVFPEQVQKFLDHEIEYLLQRQDPDGGWKSAQPMGNGRTTMQAGGTVDKVTLTAMCGYSLRKHPEHDPKRIDDAVTHALHFVNREVPGGRLKTEVQDAPWRYIYSLRFLVHEYPHVENPKVREEIQGVCAYILEQLRHMQFATKANRKKPSTWTARDESGSGGWGYLKGVKGSNTFVTADALRELLKAREVMPGLKIDQPLFLGAFQLLNRERRIQPNSQVESYSYDSAGSFQRIRDIRGDVGRLCSAELACVMYSTSFKVQQSDKRTQQHLEKALQEWLKHRGILDKVKFPSGHADFSIAPWFWMYSYRTTLEAADYLTTNDQLREKVRRIALNAFFKHMKFYFEPKLGAEGYIIGGDLTKELHDSCQMLDGLATLKHLYQPRIHIDSPELAKAHHHFQNSEYGQAYTALQSNRTHPNAQKLSATIQGRFESRLEDIRKIHSEYPLDGLNHLDEMKTLFAGHPGLAQVEKLEAQWRKNQPGLPPVEVLDWVALDPYPGVIPDGSTDHHSWGKILQAGKPKKVKTDTNLLPQVDPDRDSVKGTFQTASGQVISPSTSYARIQLDAEPQGSYRADIGFTRIKGDCMAVMFPVGNTSALLVVSGWGGKVSGLAFINGKDADRNPTTRDGKLTNGVPHHLSLTVRLLDNQEALIKAEMDGKPYLEWKGLQSSLKPDRYWRLRQNSALGLGAYNARVVFHSCHLLSLDD